VRGGRRTAGAGGGDRLLDHDAEPPPPGDPSETEAFVRRRGHDPRRLADGLQPRAPEGDRAGPERTGLDHLSFGVAGRKDLQQAARLFDEHGVIHGSITRLPPSASTCSGSKTPGVSG
jgi:hypothetical protein